MKYLKQLLLALMLVFAVFSQAHADATDDYQAAQRRADEERAALVNDFFNWARETADKAVSINFGFNKSVAEGLVQLSGVKEAVAGLIDSVTPYEAARETAKTLAGGETLTLFFILSAILVAWAGLQKMLNNGWDELFEAVITVSFFSLLVFEYDLIFGESLPKFFGTWSDAIYSASSGQAGGTISSGVGALVETIFALVLKALLAMVENAFNYMLLFLPILIIFTGPAMYKIGKSSVQVVSHVLVASGISAVALVVGPVAVALGVLPWTRKIFWGWLAVLTSALGVKVIMAATLPVFLFFSQKMDSAGTFAFGLGGSAIKDTIMLMIFAEVLVALVGLVPDVARAIFGGVMSVAEREGGGGLKQAATNTALRLGVKALTKGAV